MQSYEKQIWHCRNLSEFVRICQFLSVFGTMLFLAAKLRKRKLALSVYVSLCQSMSLCVTLCHFPTYCLFYDAKLRKVNLALSAYVRICPEMSAFVRISFSLQSYEKENWHCPALSSYVHLCPFMSSYDIASLFIYVAKLRNRNLAMFNFVQFCSLI